MGFNTASVLIQPLGVEDGLPNKAVSIQLLFLFNIAVSFLFISSQVFQYSFCSYSTIQYVLKIRLPLSFQYSFCSYSTEFTDLTLD